MSRGPQTFRQTDVTNAVKAAAKGAKAAAKDGVPAERIEVITDNFRVVYFPARPEDTGVQRKPERNEWDD